jgi:hypothetical protein
MRGIFTDGDDARRERLRHAANEAEVDWARTLRVDASPDDRVVALSRDGVRVRVSHAAEFTRTYALVEGPEGVDPAEIAQKLPQARWYDSPIIALAIEPLPPDALPLLAQALGGSGAPAGVCECTVTGGTLLLEFRPAVTPAHLIRSIIDVELRRFGGACRTRLLSPLPMATAAAIAAAGLQAPEIASDRILESLLGLEHVE